MINDLCLIPKKYLLYLLSVLILEFVHPIRQSAAHKTILAIRL